MKKRSCYLEVLEYSEGMENDAEECIEDVENTEVGENAKQVRVMIGCNQRQILDLSSDDDMESTGGCSQEIEGYSWPKIDDTELETDTDKEYVEYSLAALAHLMKNYLRYLLKLFLDTRCIPWLH